MGGGGRKNKNPKASVDSLVSLEISLGYILETLSQKATLKIDWRKARVKTAILQSYSGLCKDIMAAGTRAAVKIKP